VPARAPADRSPRFIVALSIAAFPILKPKLPGHLAPEDLLMAAAILAVIFWAGTHRIKVHVPYAVPVGILTVTGLVAAQFGIAPAAGVLAVFQELFLLAWAAAIMTFAATPRNVSIVLGAWAWSATAWAALVTLASVTQQWWLVGSSSANGARAQLWFDNPNMAGNYFLVSLFIVILGRHPRRPLARFIACALIVVAILLSGSNAALLALALGLAITGVVTVWRRVDLLNALAVASLVAMLFWGLSVYVVKTDLQRTLSDSSNELVARSVARGPKSVEGRSSLFSEEVALYRTGPFIGRGPASTRTTIDQGFAVSKVKEAHNDYLATLVERGVLGVVGLIVLVGAIGMRAFAVSLRRLRPAFRRMLSTPAAMAGLVVVMGFTAITHEILHYRHAWALFGLLAALHLHGIARPDQPDAPLEAEVVPSTVPGVWPTASGDGSGAWA
jgi:O-antigen ligase